MFPLLLISLAGTLASAGMQYHTAQQQAAQAEANAEHDAAVMDQQAEEERHRRAQEEIDERSQSRRKIASMEAAYAKSGLLMSGTPVNTITEQVGVDEYNTLSRNRFSSIAQSNQRQQAEFRRMQGEQAASAYKLGGTTALISGIGSAAFQGASYNLKLGNKNRAIV